MTMAQFGGLPQSLQTDGAWLDGPPETPQPGALRRRPRGIGFVVLVLLADALFWQQSLGLSVAVFVLAIFAVATWGLHGQAGMARPWALLVIAALPVVDMVQALSLAFLGAGLVVALLWAHHPRARLASLPGAALGFALRLPRRWISPFLVLGPGLGAARLRVNLGGLQAMRRPKAFLRNWGFPLGGIMVFLALLMDVNPMLQHLLNFDLDFASAAERALFWAGIALLVAPFLSKPLLLDPSPQLALPAHLPSFGINAGSVLRALLMFNALILLQMVTDASILIGGAGLPSGLSYADYAHRGAYPLLATAILAGTFALAARPFLGEHRLIRPLMLLWLAQNMVLCGAAALRLELYIGAYGLTYLRIYALIWMGLVAISLGLTLWQTLKDKDNAWLFARAALVGMVTLYACAFVNFAQIIAAQNLTRDRFDIRYICSLGPMASGALAGAPDGVALETFWQDRKYCNILARPEISAWQEWGFRAWRVSRYSAPDPAQSIAHENSDR